MAKYPTYSKRCGYDWCHITNDHLHTSDNPGRTEVRVPGLGIVRVDQEFTTVSDLLEGRSGAVVPCEGFDWCHISLDHCHKADEHHTVFFKNSDLVGPHQTRALPIPEPKKTMPPIDPLRATENDSEELLDILEIHLPQWAELFRAKNRDYGSGSMFELGSRGQYSDIHRKMIRVRRALWDGQDLGFEGVYEVLQDLIGHLFLTMVCLDRENAKEEEKIPSDAGETFSPKHDWEDLSGRQPGDL